MSLLPDLQVRQLVETDLDAYQALRQHTLTHPTEAFTTDAASQALRTVQGLREHLGGQGDDSGFTLVAWRGDRLVGALSCMRDPHAATRHLGHVVGAMLLSDPQAQGVGQALLSALIARASADDELQQLTLSVAADHSAALRLYEGAGFTRYGSLPRALRLGTRFVDQHLLLLQLK